MDPYIWVILISILPWIELRGAIPVGIALGIDPLTTFAIAVTANILIFFPIYFMLDHFYKYLRKYEFVRATVSKVRKKSGPRVRKYGFIGLVSFVAVPLPVTGAWTGTLIAWLMGIDPKKAFLAISLGVIIAGVLVTGIVLFAAEIAYSLGLVARV